MSGWPIDVVALSPLEGGTVLWRSSGTFRVTVVVKASFALTPDADAVPVGPEPIEREDRHRNGQRRASVQRASEVAPQVPCAGVVLTGHAIAPGEREVRAVSARLALFRDKPVLDKTLHVFGDVAPGSAAPTPFSRMPIVYERAYGGPGVDGNPIGVGAPGTTGRPNVVDARDATKPAGFGPIAATWPLRARWLARLDKTASVLEIPDGFDFDAFCPAPPDQRVPYLAGDEWIVLDNLVANRPRLQTRLPGAQARARWHLVTAGGASDGHDVPLVLDTLELDTDALLASLVWRGHFTLELPDLVGMVRLFAGVEVAGRPIAWPERHAIAPRRELAAGAIGLKETAAAPIFGHAKPALPFVAKESALAAPPAPAAPAPPPASNATSEETILTLSPALAAPALPFGAPGGGTPLSGVAPAALERASSIEFDEEHTAMISAEDAARMKKQLVAPFALAAPGTPPAAPARSIPGAPWNADRADVPLSPDESAYVAAMKDDPPAAPASLAGGPAAVRATSAWEVDEATSVVVVSAPPSPEPPRSPIAPPEPLSAAPAVADDRSGIAISQALSPQPERSEEPEAPAREPAPVESDARRRAKAKLEAGAAFDDDDYTDVDLSGLDFSGRSLARCKLGGAKLRGAALHGAMLAGAQLAGADLTGAGLEGADFTRADLTNAVLRSARLDGAKLTDAKLSGAEGTGATFRRASGQRTVLAKGTWTDAIFDDADLAGADFGGATLERTSLRGASLAEVRLNDARASEAIFDRARLPDARAKGAGLVRSSFEGVDASRGAFGKAALTGSSFVGANLTSASFVEASCGGAKLATADLRDATFDDADLTGASLDAAKLDGAKLKRTRGEGASFDGAALNDADLRKAAFPRASFANASLRGARAEEADFAEARFVGADLSGASLRAAKLGRALLTRARLDRTDLRNADLEGANVHGTDRSKAKLAGAKLDDLVETAPDDAPRPT